MEFRVLERAIATSGGPYLLVVFVVRTADNVRCKVCVVQAFPCAGLFDQGIGIDTALRLVTDGDLLHALFADHPGHCACIHTREADNAA